MTDSSKFRPDWFSPPSDSIRYLMRRRTIPAYDLALHFRGGADTLRGLLEGTTPIDSEIAGTLANALGGTEYFWRTRQLNFEKALHRAVQRTPDNEADEWLSRIPAPGSKERHRPSAGGREAELRRRLLFYNVCNIRSWDSRYSYFRDETLFRKSHSYRTDSGAVSMWLRLGELESDLISTRPWHPDNLRDRLDSIRGLCKVSRPTRFLPKLRTLFAEAGIAMVVVPSPRGCPVSGASKLTSPDRAMILMSFRYRSDDQFWFTLFHEIGHLLLHGGNTFVDDDIMTGEEQWEVEANEFATSCIIPGHRQQEFEDLEADYRSVMRFSVSISVSPGLIVGQLQHHGRIGYRRLNNLKRHWTWDDITPGLT